MSIRRVTGEHHMAKFDCHDEREALEFLSSLQTTEDCPEVLVTIRTNEETRALCRNLHRIFRVDTAETIIVPPRARLDQVRRVNGRCSTCGYKVVPYTPNEASIDRSLSAASAQLSREAENGFGRTCDNCNHSYCSNCLLHSTGSFYRTRCQHCRGNLDHYG